MLRAKVLLLAMALSGGSRVMAQDDAKADQDLGPTTIRIQSTTDPKKGYWVEMPGFREVGSPSFSNDGDWIAFDAYKSGYNLSPSECWIARKNGMELTKVTVGATPRWSPDGKQLLFMRDTANDPNRPAGIFVINRDGKGERKICDGRWPDWSPDGRSIVFSSGGRRGPFGGSRIMSRIYTIRVDGTARKEIADGDAPSWSPDGKRVACIQQDPIFKTPFIRVVDLKSLDQRFRGFGWFRANWSADSSTLVSNGVDKQNQTGMLVRSSWDVGDPEFICPEFAEGLAPNFSADQQWIVFIAHRLKGK